MCNRSCKGKTWFILNSNKQAKVLGMPIISDVHRYINKFMSIRPAKRKQLVGTASS